MHLVEADLRQLDFRSAKIKVYFQPPTASVSNQIPPERLQCRRSSFACLAVWLSLSSFILVSLVWGLLGFVVSRSRSLSLSLSPSLALRPTDRSTDLHTYMCTYLYLLYLREDMHSSRAVQKP